MNLHDFFCFLKITAFYYLFLLFSRILSYTLILTYTCKLLS
nr:MAG TPA: hypothetical protein [Caudoviricetes sp.]